MDLWHIGATANIIVAVVYLAIAWVIASPLLREGQLGSNRLGTATAVIFFTCAVGHTGHALHLFGLEGSVASLRDAYSLHEAVWDVITAAAGSYYWTLRRTYGSLMKGAKLFEDMRERQRQALEINDNIVQGLFVAQAALAMDERALSEEALRNTLASARNIISDLLGESGTEMALGPGQLVRQSAAVVNPDEQA